MIEKMLKALPEWARSEGDNGDIVLSSRIRLARNIRNYPFPHRASESQLEAIVSEAEAAVDHIAPDKGKFVTIRLDSLVPLERLVFVEKHLISRDFLEHPEHRAILLNEDETASIMVNEEDQLRIQSILAGFKLEQAWDMASKLDDDLEDSLDYAFDEYRGYLTACPTNVGTGLRASVMLHLPALVMTDQAKKVLATLTHLGLNVRGLYGEGTEALGNLFQISNQVTLGYTEEDLIAKLVSAARQVVEQERGTRDILMKESRLQLEDRLCRAYGILTQARVVPSEEALRLLSDIRLGADLELIPNLDAQAVRELFLLIRAAFLQTIIGKELAPAERDYYRAMVIRDHLKRVKGKE
ncbi:MAG TPA: protein arginine kinase [Bacillota bacterium]|nr:protein arginine kinase [Bacillota bacterium]